MKLSLHENIVRVGMDLHCHSVHIRVVTATLHEEHVVFLCVFVFVKS